jgi:hypothetical protein
MSRRVTVELTVAEAKALWQAAGEVLDHPDAAEASFPNPAQRLAAGRGHDKLAAAWVAGERRSS